MNKKFCHLLLVFIILLGIGSAAYYQMVYIPKQKTVINTTPPTPSVPSAVVQQGNLTVYARGTGILMAPNQAELGFGAGGLVAELKVKHGDQVHTGDILAVQGNQEQLALAVSKSQLTVMKAQQALQSLTDDAPAIAAKVQLDWVNAKAALQKTEYNRNIAQKGHRASATTIATTQAKLALAQTDLAQAKARYQLVASHPANTPDQVRELANAQLDMATAQKNYDSLLSQLNWYSGQPTEFEQQQLDAAVAQAQALVAQTERLWNKIKDGPDPDALALAEQELANSKAELALAKHNLAQASILAPFDSTILTVRATAGQDVSGPFITLADLSQLSLEVSLNATDLGKIKLGDPVEVIFDALPNQVFTGTLVHLDSILYDTSGQIAIQTPGQVSIIKGVVSLDDQNLTSKNLPLGMSATVNILDGQAEGVMLVPVEALVEQSPGNYAVTVLNGGKQQVRPVQVGLQDISFAEIKSGLQVGEVVLLNLGSKK